MLRGWDAGYSIPSYGVFIREAFAGRGLSTMTLHMAISLCKRRGARTVMLKVHPDNVVAKKTYEKFGFVASGRDPKIDNIIYRYDVPGDNGIYISTGAFQTTSLAAMVGICDELDFYNIELSSGLP
jgi:hypothetical protein